MTIQCQIQYGNELGGNKVVDQPIPPVDFSFPHFIGMNREGGAYWAS